MKRRTMLHVPVLMGAAALPGASTQAQADIPQVGSDWQLEQRPVHTSLGAPVGMGFDRTGHLYVANWSAGTVLRFSPSGERSTFARGLGGPSGLAIASGGDIFVASYSEDLVWRFTPSGERSVFVHGLATPAGLTFDARGRLLIANRGTNQILAAHPDGRVDVAAQGLQTPVGAVALPDGRLMVSNIAGGVAVAGADKQARTVNTELRSPGPGIVRASDDAVYVVDYGGSTVSRIDAQGRRSIVADGLSSPVGLATSPEGNLMVATWGDNAVFRIRRL